MIALHYTGVGDSSSCLGAATGDPAQLEGGLDNKVEENFFYQIFNFCNISAMKSRTIGLSVTEVRSSVIRELPMARSLWGRNRNWQLANYCVQLATTGNYQENSCSKSNN